MRNVIWSEDEINILERFYPFLHKKRTQKFLAALGFHRRSTGSIRMKAKDLGIEKMEDGPFLPNFELTAGEQTALENALLSDFNIPEDTPKETQYKPITHQEFEYMLDEVLKANKKKSASELLEKSQQPKDKPMATLVLSDTHFGDIVRDFDGNIIFNPERCLSMIKEIPEMMAAAIPPRKTKGCCVNFCGDLVTGEDIYDGQAFEIAFGLCDQMDGLDMALYNMLGELEALYEFVHAVWVPGNHERSSKKKAKATNFSWILFKFVKLMCEKDRNLNVFMERSFGNVGRFDVNGRVLCSRHIGVPQDSTPARKGKLAIWEHIHKYDILTEAHVHHPGLLDYVGIPIVRNGTLKPPGEFAEALGYWGRPKQACFELNSSGEVLSNFNWLSWWNDIVK